MGTVTNTALSLIAAVQFANASIEGVVRSDTGAPIEGAIVRLTDLERVAVTGPDGRYSLSGVPPGPWHLAVSSLGHAGRTVHALVPGSGTLRVDVILRSEPIPLEGLRVIGDAGGSDAPREPDPVPGSRVRTLSSIRGHPLLAEPDALEVLTGGPVTLDPEAPTRLHIRGGGGDHTAFRLDGIPILDPVHAAGLFSAWSPDALARVELGAPYASPEQPEALSGTVSGWLREPGGRHDLESRLATTQASMTVRGPLGSGGGGYVASARAGYPGAFAPGTEPSYLRGESGDGLLRLSGRVLGGDAVLLAYEAENELTAASATDERGSAPPDPHRFEWASRSLGATWRRVRAGSELDLRLWRATTRAYATWSGEPPVVDADRSDIGLQVRLRLAHGADETEIGVRAGQVTSRYATAAPAARRHLAHLSVFGERRAVVGAFESRLGLALLGTAHDVRPAPRAQLAWRDGGWSWALSAGRAHQLTQSQRNAESPVGKIFGADPSVVAGADGVPIPHADQLVLTADWRDRAGLRLELEVFARRMRDVVLVAPRVAGPLSAGDWLVGDGSARGASAALSATRARYSWLLAYGWQDVLLVASPVAYPPEHGMRHRLDVGVVVHLRPTLDVRAAARAIAGRPGTDVAGGFEWEACNLLDLGCEFAGSPTLDGAPGARRLPAYVRVDLGGRRHWHLRLAGRDHLIGVYGSVTNVLGRRNVLAFARDPDTGTFSAEHMRPPSPLVFGLEWRF